MATKPSYADFRLLAAEPAQVDRFPPLSPVVLLRDYWQSIAPAPGVLPGRQHFDPLDVDVGVVPWIFLMDVIRGGDGVPLDYRYRLVGTGNVQLVGRDATGELASAVFGRVDAPFVLETFDLTVANAAPTYWIATVPQDRIGEVTIHRGLFPLARDGGTVDMLLCVAAPWPPA
ncbi:PAS domain-containing protein [Thalassobaculum sp.]|uniref:PAS domain-containing protein n=1 Tax=Thalassobaculum sp. TaxID=2022740 RepID=UPI0032ED2827